jgi:flavorubredoxin
LLHGKLISTIPQAIPQYTYFAYSKQVRPPDSKHHPSAALADKIIHGLPSHNVQQYCTELQTVTTKKLEIEVHQRILIGDCSSALDYNNRAAHMVDAVVAYTSQEHPV